MIAFFFHSRIIKCPQNGADVANQRDMIYLDRNVNNVRFVFLDKEKVELKWVLYVLPTLMRSIRFGFSPLYLLHLFEISKIRFIVQASADTEEIYLSSCVMLLAINKKHGQSNVYVRHHNSEVNYLAELSRSENVFWRKVLIKKSIMPLKKMFDEVYLNNKVHHLFFTENDINNTFSGSSLVSLPENFLYRPVVSDIKCGASPLSSVERIFFFGSAHTPNIEVAEWVENTLLSELKKLNRRIEVIVACGGYKINSYEKGDIVFNSVEWISDPFGFDVCSTLYLLPAFHGSGIKIKILEALEAGVTVMTNASSIHGVPETEVIIIPDDKILASHSVVDNILELDAGKKLHVV